MFGIVVGLVLSGGAKLARAAVIAAAANAVDVIANDGTCSLREAIVNANNNNQSGSADCVAGSGADTIVLPAGTYTLAIPGINEDLAATGDLDIAGDLIINGGGAAITSIDGAGLDRVIQVRAGGTVTLSGVTVSGGRRDFAGGILNQGTLTLIHCVVSGNTANFGAGIFNWTQSTLALTDSTVTGNTASLSNGGGILNQGATTLADSVVSGNTANGTGGGILNNQGTLVLTHSTVSANTSGLSGGGISSDSAWTMTGSTVSGNTAANGNGGGIYNRGPMTLTNSTVSGNTAVVGGGIADCGSAGTATIVNCTLSENSVSQTGGGIDTCVNNHALVLRNTIIANSGAGADCTAQFTGGHNLIENPGNPCAGGSGDIVAQDPLLGPLQNNGGATDTHELLPSSPAIDAGDNAACPSDDQRGVARPYDGNNDGIPDCDIGAYEYGAPTPTSTATPTATATPTPVGFVGRRREPVRRPRRRPRPPLLRPRRSAPVVPQRGRVRRPRL